MKDKILLFIPCYNCEKQVIRVLKQIDNQIKPFIDRVILVNNRSADSTEKVITDFINQCADVDIRLLRNDDNYGLGGSHKVAFHYALENNFDYVIVLHGDDQGCIQDLLPVFKSGEYKNLDACLGARFKKGSTLTGYSKFRIFGNIVFNIAFSIGLGRRIYDLGSGLNMYQVKSLESRYYDQFADDLTFNCYMLLATNYYKQKVKFIPISWREVDQVSNVKMVSQAFNTLGLLVKFFLMRGKFIKSDLRKNTSAKYTTQVISTTINSQ